MVVGHCCGEGLVRIGVGVMNSESRGGATVIWLAVHTTEGIMRARDLLAWTSWPGSSHASNDETGVLLGPEAGFVPYNLASWTLRAGNPFSDNLEQCGWARWSRAEWLSRPLLLGTTAQWIAARHAARPWIPITKLSPAEVGAGKAGVIGHVDYTVGTGDGSHTDPGPGYPWDVVIEKARDLAFGIPKPGPTAEETEMFLIRSESGSIFLISDNWAEPVKTDGDNLALQKKFGPPVTVTTDFFNRAIANARRLG